MKKYKNLLFILILLCAAFFRFSDLNWDQGFHLHPDERFLTMVGNAMTIPKNGLDYFSSSISPFNPTNIGYNFFVYGTFPVVLNKLIATTTGNNDYDKFALQGRFLSAFSDLLIIFVVFGIAKLLEKELQLDYKIKYFASFFYAISVLPIQLSHFFTVDTFLNFFAFSSFYFSLKYFTDEKNTSIVFSAILLGIGLACKITSLFVLPLNLVVILLIIWRKKLKIGKKLLRFFTLSIIYGIILYLSVRIFEPYYFDNQNFLNPTLNESFLHSLSQLKAFDTPDAWYPPGVQWIHKIPIIFSLKNLILFGVGIPYAVFTFIGFFQSVEQKRSLILKTIMIWMLVFFIYQSTQFVQTMRYLILLYPFLAFFAGFGFYWFVRKCKNHIARIIALIIVSLWPLSFFSIYTKPQSRVEASIWIYQNIPANSILLGEHWDDSLPLLMPSGKQFKTIQLPVFDPDTQEKWTTIDGELKSGDYLILSSNRGWGSIPTVSERYPVMTKFYKDLFEGKLSYKKIKEFDSFPSLRYLGIPIDFPDTNSEEAFTVYDHPQVIIFKHF